MKKTKNIQDGTTVYVAWYGEVKKNTVSYSFFDRETGERTYITEGVCFTQSDIGKIVFTTEEEAKKAARARKRESASNNKKVQFIGSKKIRRVIKRGK